jgi:hypothetical protein
MKWYFLKILSIMMLIHIVSACSKNGETNAQYADVQDVSVTGIDLEYSFSVTLKSPDTGCRQYADWWEVISPDGELIYRRILLHSHVNEQPFTRSGGPVEIEKDQEVIVRAHMNNTGYGGMALQGTVSGGFEKIVLAADFADSLEKEDPLPTGCNF